ncbi:tyrosine-type recombinase/integrase [Nonomuraea fuscirosea]|uniref:tyrosine-type recombinase/integrase n=1 Tax=Nonomuraea fuscirosea TaxID=1291556 RepID=UPI002DD9B2E1|nr:tyrosine-type recombinase/integrase [Nonomuraea fuscirosea]WSA48281.1 tyrosine-type recombinase/integrase [Nonomuraea fuscirosea]
MEDTTYSVRIYKTEARKNAAGKVTSYRVEWATGGKRWRSTFQKSAQADAYRSKLLIAAREGEPFSLLTGEPVSWNRAKRPEMSWYDFACKFADFKWKAASAKYRQDIARALTAATPAMFASSKGKPADLDLRTAMRRWGFNTKQRAEASEETAEVLAWLSKNTHPVSALAEAAVVRALLDAATSRLNGKPAATSTIRRHKTILQNALDYAVELKLLDANPIKALRWKPPRVTYEVDKRSVVNHAQARRLLAEVAAQKPSGRRLVAFFAIIYYAGLRPEEVVKLAGDNVTLPELVTNPETGELEEPADDWGELHLAGAAPFAGREWTDDGSLREERALKHRADGETRTVPCPPALTRILRAHLAEFGTGPGDRLFTGVRGGELPGITYRRVWAKAREKALTKQEAQSPLARRIYDLRHACVSTWLNAGVPATQVAEWAGHSVEVLLRIYAKCVVGQDAVARQRIDQALRDDQRDP